MVSRSFASILGLLLVMVTILGSCAAGNPDSGADEARATILRYVEALGGAEPDRGWSLLNEETRGGGYPEDLYQRVASAAVGPPPIEDIELTDEDDGLYVFTVAYGGELNDAYAQVLHTGSPIGCPNGPNQFEMAVIVGDGEFAGITPNSCADGEVHDPRESDG